MPLVAHNDLPAFDRLRQQGRVILDPRRARHQDIRELHIGLLNMMPDAALQATERQFFRLLDTSNFVAQIYVHPFSLPEQSRSEQAHRHIEKYYETFEQIRQQGLDALIISGAGITCESLSQEAFWQPLQKVIDWAGSQVTSTICSCRATHAVIDFLYGQQCTRQAEKKWGVYQHQVCDSEHPLVKNINSRFDAPHSRWYDISISQCRAAGLPLLIASEQAGMHLVTSPDRIRFVMFQGHPEYDTISLLKEYKREVIHYLEGQTAHYPPLVENYFNQQSQAILREYRSRVTEAHQKGRAGHSFPEEKIAATLDNTWQDTSLAIISRWIGLVYQLTHQDRHKPFMDYIDPNDPLSTQPQGG